MRLQSKFGALACLALALTAHAENAATNTAGLADAAMLFKPVFDVLVHPRCLNCHTLTDYPRQGDDRHRHHFLVARGNDDRGAIGARCGVCHQAQNQTGSGVPGAPHWRLAPLTMAWESEPGVAMTASALCKRLLDKKRNGGRDLAALERHMDTEPLVRWAWNPGANSRREPRALPPLTQAAFLTAFRAWAAAGAPCPH